MRVKLTQVPQDSTLKAGDWFPVKSNVELDKLTELGVIYISEEADLLLKTREVTVDNALKASKAFAPKEDTAEIRADALQMETNKPGAGVKYIQSFQPAPDSKLSARLTQADTGAELHSIESGDAGLRETIKGFFKAAKPMADHDNTTNGGFLRACRTEKEIKDHVLLARDKMSFAEKIQGMILKGANVRLDGDFLKAAADNYADPNGALGVLNTALTLLWNFGYLENELVMVNDITTDVSGVPIKYLEWARSRYIKVPGVQIKALGSSWSGGAGNDVDVSIRMSNYAGVPITVENATLGATARPLLNEQKSPQLYGLAEYIIYTLINTAINGSTRFGNDGTTTSNIKAASAFIDPKFGAGHFDVSLPASGSLLPVFVSKLRKAMNLSKFPGGNEAPGARDLQRFAWVHSNLEAGITSDPNYELISSIQGIRQNPDENLIQTGMFTRLGNNRFRASQLVTDNNSLSGSGADGGANAASVVPGDGDAAKIVGIGGTRSGLMFCSRPPLDYTKNLPEVSGGYALELFTSPKIGIPFVVMKFFDHAAETANMIAKAMWGSGVGDERQLMLFQQQA